MQPGVSVALLTPFTETGGIETAEIGQLAYTALEDAALNAALDAEVTPMVSHPIIPSIKAMLVGQR